MAIFIQSSVFKLPRRSPAYAPNISACIVVSSASATLHIMSRVTFCRPCSMRADFARSRHPETGRDRLLTGRPSSAGAAGQRIANWLLRSADPQPFSLTDRQTYRVCLRRDCGPSAHRSAVPRGELGLSRAARRNPIDFWLRHARPTPAPCAGQGPAPFRRRQAIAVPLARVSPSSSCRTFCLRCPCHAAALDCKLLTARSTSTSRSAATSPTRARSGKCAPHWLAHLRSRMRQPSPRSPSGAPTARPRSAPSSSPSTSGPRSGQDGVDRRLHGPAPGLTAPLRGMKPWPPAGAGRAGLARRRDRHEVPSSAVRT